MLIYNWNDSKVVYDPYAVRPLKENHSDKVRFPKASEDLPLEQENLIYS
jgi:hypothetical protein